jgi:general secretion pathway protein I
MNRGTHPVAGFTLLEVLVALAIVALGIGLAYPRLSDALGAIARAHDDTTATMVAQSTLERVGHDIALADGTATGRSTDGFDWQVDIAAYNGDQLPRTGPLRGYLVRVTVAWTENNRRRQTSLTTLRLARRNASS